MPRPPSSSKKRRLNLDLSEEVRQRLDDLRDDTDAESLSEVIRRSVALYDLMVRERRAGSSFEIKARDGKSKELVFL